MPGRIQLLCLLDGTARTANRWCGTNHDGIEKGAGIVLWYFLYADGINYAPIKKNHYFGKRKSLVGQPGSIN